MIFIRHAVTGTALLFGLAFAGTASAWNWQTDSCRTATAGTSQWQNAPLVPLRPETQTTTQPGLYSLQFRAVPMTVGGDTLFGASQGPQTNWRGIATIVRFNRNGMIDVRDGDIYRADVAMPYQSREYWVRMEVNMAAHTYSVYVAPYQNWTSFRNEVRIAKDYRFRTEQQAVTKLDNMVVEAEIGELHVCQDERHSCLQASPGAAQWQNASTQFSFGQSDARMTWSVTPQAAGSDALLALTQGPQTNWRGLGGIVRFNSNNTIDVRNGDRYQADSVVRYEPGKKYLVEITAGISSPSNQWAYSVSVTPPGGSEQRIATNYAFRTEQQNITEVNNWTAEAERGGLYVCYIEGELN